MKLQLVDRIGDMFRSELPVFDNMDAYVDFILQYVKPHSEDLDEQHFFINKRWKEFRDTEDFHESVLFIFQDDSSFLLSIDGNIGRGSWKTLNASNTLILDSAGKKEKSELYDLAFLNKDFLVLKKHGDQKRINHHKYLVLGNEKTCGRLDWIDLMEKWYDIYRKNWMFVGILVLFGLILAFILLFTFL